MYFVADLETLSNKFTEKADAEAFVLRRGGALFKLVGQIEKPEIEENVWSAADKERYERELEKAEKAWAVTNNED